MRSKYKDMNKVVVIDYGLSNLLSVKRAFEMFADSVVVTDDLNEVISASRVVLPGVGAFADGMRGLKDKGLDEALLLCVEKQIPVLGICLGMQMLFEKSYEKGEHNGLGFIKGTVEKIPDRTVDGGRQRVPQIGWSALRPPEPYSQFDSALLSGIEAGNDTYFIHSYECKPLLPEYAVAYTHYGGRQVCAIANYENIYGCQFHPEKSGKIGLKLIRNFCCAIH